MSNQRIHPSESEWVDLVIEIVNVRYAVSSLTVFVVRHFVSLRSLIVVCSIYTILLDKLI